jgi:CRISPR-associated protein Cas1
MSRGALNVLELWPTVGYLHEFIGCQTKQSLVYDLQEPYRWIADVAVMEAFESGVLDLPDFYFTGNDYRYHFEPEAKQRFIELMRVRFNSGVRYNGRGLKWDTVIEQKAAELGRYLVSRTDRLTFSEPSPDLHRTDDRELRRQILGLSQSEALRLGIGKSTMHYLRRNARNQESFEIYDKLGEKLG